MAIAFALAAATGTTSTAAASEPRRLRAPRLYATGRLSTGRLSVCSVVRRAARPALRRDGRPRGRDEAGGGDQASTIDELTKYGFDGMRAHRDEGRREQDERLPSLADAREARERGARAHPRRRVGRRARHGLSPGRPPRSPRARRPVAREPPRAHGGSLRDRAGDRIGRARARRAAATAHREAPAGRRRAGGGTWRVAPRRRCRSGGGRPPARRDGTGAQCARSFASTSSGASKSVNELAVAPLAWV